ncbi:hypothetical protein Rsub_10984 [Raphidocelis subcapitata]|uniref:Uncharacterized protein n=1 Tax=Raphidocelis subcapitata TaxID=307507 RepID=A0A2V0PEN2_9CHLO|nr:hypothetical protein Rsub_10984 [Raphidocelis subcapitata]|eukprot:GBF98321.1 hypothetical protein Rsub_10984 [Raphidocelis subcapitata]
MEATTATLKAGCSSLVHAGEVRSRPGSALGAAALPGGPSLAPGRPSLRRQSTLAKGFRHMRPPAALPLFDMSVAVLDSLNLMRASMEEEVVLTSTLAVPAHHALACRIEAYGTPFGAPPLQAVIQGELSEVDKQFAACLAAPPDFDAAGAFGPEVSLQRMASLSALQRSPSLAAARAEEEAATPTAARGGAAAGRHGGALLRSPSVQPDSEKKTKKALPAAGGMRRDSAGEGLIQSVSEYEAAAAASAAAAGAAAAQLPRTPPRQALPPPPPPSPSPLPPLAGQLFAACDDAVAALVGCGYLLLRAARFDARAPEALSRMTMGLRRVSLARRSSAASELAAAAALAGY